MESQARNDTLRLRAKLLRAIRFFFDQRGYTEVETPIRVPIPALELHIDAMPSGDHFLRTSPEFQLKQLIADGLHNLYQIGSCFRVGEKGDRHHPEFTMLEWYETPGDAESVMQTTRELLLYIATELQQTSKVSWQGQSIDLAAYESHTVSELFKQYAGWDPVERFDPNRFDEDLVNLVEPKLPKDRLVFVTHYPAPLAALAKLHEPKRKTAARWELYLGGIELANAYDELTDAGEQRQRLVDCADDRAELNKPAYEADPAFLAALERGMPQTGGIALGIDRLMMILADIAKIQAVRALAEE